jgi:hypothetical protein
MSKNSALLTPLLRVELPGSPRCVVFGNRHPELTKRIAEAVLALSLPS